VLLRKHYLDLVTSDDRVRIVYAAELRLGALDVRYCAVLRADPGGQPRTETKLGGATEPVRDGRTLRFGSAPLGFECTYERTLAGPRVEILPGGALRWDCHTLRARVTFRDRDEILHGTGYAETLETTIAPWEYPWDELRWGRLHDADGSVVWTVLEGGGAGRAYFARGPELASGETIPDLGEITLLRSGRIGDTVLSVIPGLERLPGRILGLSETKQLARSQAGGRAIHETVRWPARA
jgi:hypothetical protein